MSTYFSEFRVRCLAEHIEPRIRPVVEAALAESLRVHLPGLLMDALRHEIGAEYTPSGSAAARRDRDNLIRARFNGKNAAELSKQSGLSIKQIMRIARGVK